MWQNVKISQRFRRTILEHPPYRPDLAPSDFHLFPALKDHLSGHRLASDGDVKIAGASWSKLQGTEL
jgi:hypothetical protein